MNVRDWLERRGLRLSEYADARQRGEYTSLLTLISAFGTDSQQVKAALKDYRNQWAHHIDLNEQK